MTNHYGSGGHAFTGRRKERALLAGMVARAVAGEPRVVLLDGPAGVGKSALVRQLATCDLPSGTKVGQVSGEESEALVTFGVAALLRSALDGRPPRVTAVRPPGEAADSADVGAELLASLDLALAGAPLLVLVVDDAQWADRPSLDALRFVLRRLGREPVLALVCCRDADAELPEGLVRLAGQAGARMTLEGLDVPEVAALAAELGHADLSRAAARRLREHTEGSPLHVRALLAELDSATLAVPSGPLPAPRSYSRLVAARVARCSPEARALVEAAAVAGAPCPLHLAAAVAGLDQPLPALQEAVAADLLEVAGAAAGRVLAFPHPLVGSALYHAIDEDRRARLHAAAARHTAGAAALEHRVAAAATTDPLLSGELERLAGDEGLAGRWDEAASHLAAAARLADRPARRDALVLDALLALAAGGRVADAHALAGESPPRSDTARRDYVLGKLALLSGHLDEAAGLLTRAWERAREGAPEVAAAAALDIGDLRLIQAQLDEAIAWGRRALAAGVEDAVRAGARRLLALALAMSGRMQEALAEIAGVRRTVALPHDHEPLLAAGIVRLWAGDVATARGDLRVVAEAGAARCPLRLRLSAMACLAKAEYHLGEWDAAVVHGETAVSLAQDAGHAWALPFLHATASVIPAARGAWDAATVHAERSSRTILLPHATDRAYAAHAHAHLGFARDDPAAVVRAVEPVLDVVGDGRIDEPGAMPWYELYADALVALGRLDEANDPLERLERAGAPRRPRLSMAHSGRIRGALEAARGRPEAAREAFEGAIEAMRGHPGPFDVALLHERYGRFLRRSGARREARRHLRAAHEAYTSLDAQPFAERCTPELAACGLPVERAGAGAGAKGTLTTQELAVATLVARGLTNRQIAGELVLSIKTIEYHLGNAYRKLGVSSRTQLLLYLTEHG